MMNAVLLLPLVLLAVSGPAAASGLSPLVQRLCDDYWNWRLADMPEFATFVGFHNYNYRLDDLSMGAYESRLSNVEMFMGRVTALEPFLTYDVDITNMMVLKDELDTYIKGYPYKNFYNALNNLEGIQVDFLRLLSWMPQKTMDNYATMLVRMEKVPEQMDQIIDLLSAGVADGIAMHNNSLNKVTSQIDALLVTDPEDSPIYKRFFANFPANTSLTDDQKEDIQHHAKIIISSLVTPAYQKLRDYVSTEYVTRPNIAVTSLPNGADLYALLIKFHAGTEARPEEIQRIGYEEVDRIATIMQQLVFDMGYNMTTEAFSNMVLEDPDNFFTTEEGLLEGFEYVVYNVTTPPLPEIFKNIPKAPMLVKANPRSTTAAYLSGSYDGSRPGVFYVGTADLGSEPKFGMLTLSLHEGNPGHHLQGAHAIESPTMPYFRSTMEDRNYGQSPSRFPIRAYYAEGWALYSEALGFDMSLYGDPMDRYGHYSAEIFRACRLVVDTGIHALGWTRDEAVDYILKYTAMTRLATENEVDRYITWPGQALAYKIGQLQLSEFRANAENDLGSKFDIKDFHDVVLESIGQMYVVEDAVNDWVQSVLDAK